MASGTRKAPYTKTRQGSHPGKPKSSSGSHTKTPTVGRMSSMPAHGGTKKGGC
jgi:hypothetical protein